MMDNSPRVERLTKFTAGDGSATLLYAYHTLGVLRHQIWCLSTPPQCGIPTFTCGTSKLKVLFSIMVLLFGAISSKNKVTQQQKAI